MKLSTTQQILKERRKVHIAETNEEKLREQLRQMQAIIDRLRGRLDQKDALIEELTTECIRVYLGRPPKALANDH
jgi:flagellin-specific chaperone FliS